MDLCRLILSIAMGISAVAGIPTKNKSLEAECLECLEAKHSHAQTEEPKKRYCGAGDAGTRGLKRFKRYILRGVQWDKKTITWRLKNFTPMLNPGYTLKAIAKAFKQWEMHSGLNTKRVMKGKADIIISFEPKKHYIYNKVYCNMQFDGPGGTIGHAFYPLKNAVYAGNIHMDRGEEFSTDGSFGFNFQSAITHEIGHSLGLMHSQYPQAVMNPEYAMAAKGTNIDLHIDDIAGIQELYGLPNSKVDLGNAVNDNTAKDNEENQNGVQMKAAPSMATTKLKTTRKAAQRKEQRNRVEKDDANPVHDNKSGKNNHILDNEVRPNKESAVGIPNARIEAATKVHPNANQMPEKDDQPIKPTLVSTAARNSSADDSGLAVQSAGLNRPRCPTRFNAIYVSKFDSKTYVFNKLFRYSLGNWLGYEGIANNNRRKFLFTNVDAVYRRVRDDKLILFSGQLYAVYRDDVILERYGAIYDFGLPYEIKKVDAAVIFGPFKNTYFFTGDNYWRYNERFKSMDPGYPKKISSVWKGVPSYVDAAITWKNGMTYFFKDEKYYRLHTHTAQVESGYPKLIDPIWTRCDEHKNTKA